MKEIDELKVCDNCKQPPTIMHTEEGEECWFFVIQKNQDEPISLVYGEKEMPEFCFSVCLDRDPTINAGEQAICGKCFEAMYPEGMDQG